MERQYKPSHHSVKMVPATKIKNVDEDINDHWKILQDFTKQLENVWIPSNPSILETTILKTHLPKPRKTQSSYHFREVRWFFTWLQNYWHLITFIWVLIILNLSVSSWMRKWKLWRFQIHLKIIQWDKRDRYLIS